MWLGYLKQEKLVTDIADGIDLRSGFLKDLESDKRADMYYEEDHEMVTDNILGFSSFQDYADLTAD